MNRPRLTMASVVAASALFGAVGASTSADAAADPVIGMQVLDLMCEAKGGTPVNTPFTISRCQSARAKRGFDIEQLVCEGLLEGTFATTPTVDRRHRTNWFCFPGALSD